MSEIALKKLKINNVLEKYGSQCKVLIPIYPSDYKEYKKISTGSIISASITQSRNIHYHKSFFARLRLALNNDFIQKFFRTHNVDYRLWQVLKRQEKDELSAFLWLLKWLILPHKYILNPKTLKRIETVSSISFSEMDELEFRSFTEKVNDLMCSVLDVNYSELFKESERYY